MIFANLLIFSHVACAEMPVYLDRFDQAHPERVIQHLKNVPKTQKKLAESGYEHAQRHARRVAANREGSSWGAVVKSCSESISAYPMGKTFLLGIEAELKHWVEVRERKPIEERDDPAEILQRMAGNFDSAIAVESYERSLDDSRRDQLVLHRDCLKRYLDTKHAEADCVPLQWADIVPVK
jgi:uncharacterized protein YktB (UPF0637 family)